MFHVSWVQFYFVPQIISNKMLIINFLCKNPKPKKMYVIPHAMRYDMYFFRF